MTNTNFGVRRLAFIAGACGSLGEQRWRWVRILHCRRTSSSRFPADSSAQDGGAVDREQPWTHGTAYDGLFTHDFGGAVLMAGLRTAPSASHRPLLCSSWTCQSRSVAWPSAPPPGAEHRDGLRCTLGGTLGAIADCMLLGHYSIDWAAESIARYALLRPTRQGTRDGPALRWHVRYGGHQSPHLLRAASVCGATIAAEPGAAGGFTGRWRFDLRVTSNQRHAAGVNQQRECGVAETPPLSLRLRSAPSVKLGRAHCVLT